MWEKIRNKALALALPLALAVPLAGWAANYGFSPVTGQVTSDYGWRTDPITGNPRFHGGIDIGAPMGSPVFAPQPGVVIFSGAYGGYGNVVVLNHGNSLYTVYGHNSKLLVQPGDVVYRGQVISLVGSTGRSTGPHLHFEVHYKRQYLNPVAYMMYVQQTQQGMLAQAPRRTTSPSSVGQSSSYNMVGVSNANVVHPSAPVSINRRNANVRGQGRPSVQLLNGGDEETIEF